MNLRENLRSTIGEEESMSNTGSFLRQLNRDLELWFRRAERVRRYGGRARGGAAVRRAPLIALLLQLAGAGRRSRWRHPRTVAATDPMRPAIPHAGPEWPKPHRGPYAGIPQLARKSRLGRVIGQLASWRFSGRRKPLPTPGATGGDLSRALREPLADLS